MKSPIVLSYTCDGTLSEYDTEYDWADILLGW